MDMTINTQDLHTISYSYNVLRIRKDLAYHAEKIEKTKKQETTKSEPFFQKLGKDISNTFNKQTNESHQTLFERKNNHLISVLKFAEENNIKIIDNLDDLTAYINSLFVNDVADLRSVYVAFNIIFSNPYTNTDLMEETKKKSYKEFATALGLTSTFFIDYEKDIFTKYHYISGKNNADLIAEATKFASSIGALGALGVGIVGFVVFGSLSGAVLAGIFIASIAMILSYEYQSEKNIEELRKAFKQMNAEQVDFMLLQKLALIEALNKHRHKEGIEEIIHSLIDELINLKSDLDIALYGFRSNEGNVNVRKKESFIRFDKQLIKTLKL